LTIESRRDECTVLAVVSARRFLSGEGLPPVAELGIVLSGVIGRLWFIMDKGVAALLRRRRNEITGLS
jgi:hypothetical protein